MKSSNILLSFNGLLFVLSLCFAGQRAASAQSHPHEDLPRFAQRILIEREFPVVPEILWNYITLPGLMNTWSTAQIHVLSEGPDGQPNSVGSLREVVIQQGPIQMKLQERILRSEPARYFQYQVIRGGGLKKHLGQIWIEPKGLGSKLYWRVDYQHEWYLPTGILSKVLRKELDSSMNNLHQILTDIYGF